MNDDLGHTDEIRARVFVDDAGGFGNPVLVRLHAGDLPPADERQRVAAAAAEPATVFVAGDRQTVRIHNRKLERRFAGHPVLGTAAVLRELGYAVETLVCPAGPVRLWRDDAGVDWLHAPAAWAPNAHTRQVATPADVEALTTAPPDEPVQVWAWLDEAEGVVRARQFAPSEGKPEDEACGSATMALAAQRGRPLIVRHGVGSVLWVRPAADGVSLGGRCRIDGTPG